MYLPTGKKITIDDSLTEDAEIGVTMESPADGAFTIDWGGKMDSSAKPSDSFDSDDDNYFVTDFDNAGSREARLVHTTHSFSYTTQSDTTILATCQNVDTCVLPNHSVTLTLSAPLLEGQYNPIYDGAPKTAAVSVSDKSVATPTVLYYPATNNGGTYTKNGATPTDAGDYWAEITLSENNTTAHVGYSIDVFNASYLSVNIPDKVYNGQPQPAEVRLEVSPGVLRTLIEGKDYTIVYGYN